jgi:large subunit ribosomal protein L22
MRLVVDLIRGKSAAQALNLLRFSDKMAAAAAELTLKSAISNLQNKDAGVDPESIYVKECFVDGGPTLKRISPAPMGRAYRIRKRSHHLTIVVSVKQ